MTVQAVSGVILAAGPSRRFGLRPPKPLIDIDGEPLVRRITRRALGSELSQLIVVVGLQAAAVASAIVDLGVEIVENTRYREGQSTSVRAGLAAVEPHAAAAMFIPVDQPDVDATLINALITRYRRGDGAIVVPVYGGRRGAPVVIDRELFSELARIEGDAGGRQLFASHAAQLVELPLTDGGALADLDTRADLERFEV